MVTVLEIIQTGCYLRLMLVVAFAAAAFDTNCYVVASGPHEECVVIDPGVGVAEVLEEVFTYYKLWPSHVLLTHAHSDHVYSVTPVCQTHGIATLVHTADRYRLRDPLADLEPDVLHLFESLFGSRKAWSEPEDIREIDAATQLNLAGLNFQVTHCPGHTEGSVLFQINDIPDEKIGDNEDVALSVFAGDVIVAGGIGRTDLPGGDPAAMRKSILSHIIPLPNETLLLPGHGPVTNMRRERSSNLALNACLHHA